jgi:Xaa-Pro aminopeptidase
MEIVKEKIAQAIEILNETDTDLWMIFCRESSTTPDPSMPLVVGHEVVGKSALMISKTGETTAILSGFDTADFEKSGIYQSIISYREDIDQEILRVFERLDPKSIAINYSRSSVSADGLTHGMYLLLQSYLQNTPYLERLISAEQVIFKLRGRKTETEIKCLKNAAEIADQCWQMSLPDIETGLSEIAISEILIKNLKKLGAEISFPPIVNAGSKTAPGHGSPTKAVLEPGDLLHVDFGALVSGYCSDIQRLAYFRHQNETSTPDALKAAFDKIKTIVDATSREYKTGAIGWEIDAIARKMLQEDDYEEYNHALGHQIGREVHDGSAAVGPKWKRYGQTTSIPLERNNTFTVELGVEVPGTGYVSLEEDLVVTDQGGVFLGPRQTELIIK